MKILRSILVIFVLIISGGIFTYSSTYGYSDKIYNAIINEDIDKAEKLINSKTGNLNSVRSVINWGDDFPNIYPLQAAAMYEPELAFEMLEKGAKVDVVDPTYKSTPLIYALSSTSKDRYALANEMIELGADINKVDKLKRTALNLCVEKFNSDDKECTEEGLKLLEYLLENCKSIDKLEKESKTNPLIEAAEYNNTDALEYLLENEVYDIDSTRYGYTALILAVKHKNYEAVEMLLDYGADVDIKDPDGKKAEDYASGEIASLFD